jgi:hypothetical protein
MVMSLYYQLGTFALAGKGPLDVADNHMAK